MHVRCLALCRAALSRDEQDRCGEPERDARRETGTTEIADALRQTARGGEKVAGCDKCRRQSRQRPQRREQHRSRQQTRIAAPADQAGGDRCGDQEFRSNLVRDREPGAGVR